jgi:apolipoprotein N-acyltransferase
MSDFRSVTPLNWRKAALLIVGAVACFHAGYGSTHFGPLHLAMFGYVICLVQLSRLPTTRRAYYAGLITGFLCVAPQLTCFWKIFGPAAILLWTILALWIGAFTGMTCAALKRFGPIRTAALIPFLWMGLEYFRSELYYLKFSWMNVGYAISDWRLFPFHLLGMYGAGFAAAVCGATFIIFRARYAACAALILTMAVTAIGVLVLVFSIFKPGFSQAHRPQLVRIAGVQMEFPVEADIPRALDALLAEHTNADLLVLSEYTLLSTDYTPGGPIPLALKNWCRMNHRYLVVGGKNPAPNNNFYDTAFVLGPDGEIVFRQGKSVPIQFFKDGLPAPKQELWNSPWGKIGFCVCYDLSYTRVIDRLVKQGAQLIIVPTMDVIDWGEHQHQLHALVAPVRAAEYGVPIFRLASSGISQAVDSSGFVTATAPFAGEARHLFETFDLSNLGSGSLPLDRFLAPVSVAITAIVLVILCMPNRKRKIPDKSGAAESPDQPADQSRVSAAT